MNRTVFFILFCNLPVIVSVAEPPQQRPSSFVPNTISDQAREFLMEDVPLSTEIPETPEQWRESRKEIEALGRKLYEDGGHKYVGQAEVLSFQGDDGHFVKAHRMTPQKFHKEHADKAIMHIHGGGFCEMSPQSTYCVCAPLANLTGTRDLLLSDCIRMHRKLKSSGVRAEISIGEAMWHGFHILPSNDYPEANAAFGELADFFKRELKLDQNDEK